MAINVYEYGREGKYVFLFRYTYAGIRIINIRKIHSLNSNFLLITKVI